MTALEIRPIDELTADDVRAFVAAEPLETETLEFKREAESWAIRRAVCGLANTYGGLFVLGVAERDGAAAAVVPVANCASEAGRIAQGLAAALSPPLPGLRVRAITSDGDAGVVVIRVPASARRPHSVSKEGRGDALHVFVRRGAETRPADIREVQDMTLVAASQAETVAGRIAALQAPLLGARDAEPTTRRRPTFQIHLSAAPVSQLRLRRSDLDLSLRPKQVDFDGPYGRIVFRDLNGDWRPMFRGIEASTARKHYACHAPLHSDGAFEIRFWAPPLDLTRYDAQEEVPLYLGWWHGIAVARALWCEQIRQAVQEPALEFALCDLTSCDYAFVSLNSGDRYQGPLGYMRTGVHRSSIDQLIDDGDIQRQLNQATADFYHLAGATAPADDAVFNLSEPRRAWGLADG